MKLPVGKKTIAAAVILTAAVLVLMLRPADEGAPCNSYFERINGTLRAQGAGVPVLVLDLDRVDRNLDIIMRHIRPPLHYRIVVKSLPSMELVLHIMKKTGTNRLMIFHQPDLSLVAADPRVSADILLGKPMPAEAMKRFYETHVPRAGFDPARHVQWLIDTPERLEQYLSWAKRKSLMMRISIEIDVGLHRGGVTGTKDLGRMLRTISANRRNLTLAGFMGYEPHIASVPSLFRSREGAMRAAAAEVLDRYNDFVDYTKKNFPHLCKGDLTFNTGGSKTYKLYDAQPPINDIALGSAVVKPLENDVPQLADHLPALYIAAPVIKKLNGTVIPFIEWLSPLFSLWNPNKQVTYFIYGGQWMAQPVSPEGLVENGIYPTSTNQDVINGSRKTVLEVDDYIFFRPRQSERVMLEFSDLVVVRGGRFVAKWTLFPQR